MGILDAYQIEAVDKLKSGCILCGKTGSGKSRTAIAYYIKTCGLDYNNKCSVNDKLIPLYIITTASKRDKHEWEDDLEPFGDVKVVIDSWNNIKKYKQVENSFFIFDEQRLVGSGVWVKSFYKISKSNKWILLTATPGDKWEDYIPVFVANGFYKNRTEFLGAHAIYNRYSKYPKIDRYIGEAKLIKCRRQILVNMKYRPSADHKYIGVDVEYDKAVYRLVCQKRINIFTEKPIENISQLCYVLRKIVNSDEDRILAAKTICEDHERVIIFYNFNYELEILKNLEYTEGTSIAEWNGKKHEPLPETKRWVYLVQYTAGCEGWNCTKTDTILFYSLNYSYRVMTQARGRIDRRNTPYKTLYYYQLRSRSPIDQAILLALRKKKNFNESQFISAS